MKVNKKPKINTKTPNMDSKKVKTSIKKNSIKKKPPINILKITSSMIGKIK